jgi:hypothetical protein
LLNAGRVYIRNQSRCEEEIIMKSLLLLTALLFVMALSSSTGVVSEAANSARKQKATVQFNQPVRLMGVELKGQYLFVHDDAAMARGEACTRIYKGKAEIAGNLVVEFHCVPIQRAKANYFLVRTKQRADGIIELNEYQFEGDTEAHGTPAFK